MIHSLTDKFYAYSPRRPLYQATFILIFACVNLKNMARTIWKYSFWVCAMWNFINWGWNSCSLHWQLEVLSTGPPGKTWQYVLYLCVDDRFESWWNNHSSHKHNGVGQPLRIWALTCPCITKNWIFLNCIKSRGTPATLNLVFSDSHLHLCKHCGTQPILV